LALKAEKGGVAGELIAKEPVRKLRKARKSYTAKFLKKGIGKLEFRVILRQSLKKTLT